MVLMGAKVQEGAYDGEKDVEERGDEGDATREFEELFRDGCMSPAALSDKGLFDHAGGTLAEVVDCSKDAYAREGEDELSGVDGGSSINPWQVVEKCGREEEGKDESFTCPSGFDAGAEG